jgi:ribonucleotide reductase alpha subunit
MTVKYFQAVRKRDGRVVPFDQSRISEAIWKAMEATKEGIRKEAEEVSDKVVKELKKKYKANYVLGIEEIQDTVEEQLILGDWPKAAKSYILYRRDRAQLREIRKEIPERVKKLSEESKKYFRNPLSEFIYYRTYSRWIEEEGRRETWIETVDRYMNFMQENVGNKLTDEEYQEVREAILKQEVMPSMRLMWSAGSAALTLPAIIVLTLPRPR